MDKKYTRIEPQKGNPGNYRYYKMYTCQYCSKEFEARADMPRKYCSSVCDGKRKKIGNARYEQTNIGGCKYRATHRVIVESIIGRELDHEEVVHHINCDKKDNRIDNLVILTMSEHTKIHNYLMGRGQMTIDEYEEIINRGRQRLYAEG